VLPHPDHANWFDLSFIYWGFRGHESVEWAALRVLTDFCDHNPTVVALSPCGCFQLWVLTTRRGWIVWTTFESCFC
jgi:hypothetical protein